MRALGILVGFAALLAAAQSPAQNMPEGALQEPPIPRQALAQAHAGYVALCCLPDEDLHFMCVIGAEWPAHEGFGEAALRVADALALSPADYSAFLRGDRSPVWIPITFVVDSTPAETKETIQENLERTKDMCRSPNPAIS